MNAALMVFSRLFFHNYVLTARIVFQNGMLDLTNYKFVILRNHTFVANVEYQLSKIQIWVLDVQLLPIENVKFGIIDDPQLVQSIKGRDPTTVI